MKTMPKILIMIESSRTCERDFLRGVARYARSHGPWAFYRKPQYYLSSKRQSYSTAQLQSFDLDGVIISDTENRDRFLGLKLPTIVHTFKSDSHDTSMVVGDTQATGRMGAEHLLSLGYKHYAFCGIGDYYWSRKRYTSFKASIGKAGFETYYHELKPNQLRDARPKVLRALSDWLASLPKPLGLMTCADDCSQHVIEACKGANILIPEQIGILGVDNDDMICELANPALSSIALNFEASGYQSAQLLDQQMTSGQSQTTSITVNPTHVAVRASTDILAIDDPDVAAAVRFIRMHSHQLIQIADVMNEVTCCQRLLHEKFKRILRRTVHQEIKRVRIEKIAQMLRDTDLTIHEIASKLGYGDANHLSRYFQQEMTMSPSAYRKHIHLESGVQL